MKDPKLKLCVRCPQLQSVAKAGVASPVLFLGQHASPQGSGSCETWMSRTTSQLRHWPAWGIFKPPHLIGLGTSWLINPCFTESMLKDLKVTVVGHRIGTSSAEFSAPDFSKYKPRPTPTAPPQGPATRAPQAAPARPPVWENWSTL